MSRSEQTLKNNNVAMKFLPQILSLDSIAV